MLATDELLHVSDYNFKSSPGSSSDDSFVIDYDLPYDEDFLQELSAGLDIPLFLNQDKDEMSLFSSLLDKSAEEIMSEISSSTRSPQEFGNESQKWETEVKTEIKTETEELHIVDECCSTDSSNSDSSGAAQNSNKNVHLPPRRIAKASKKPKITIKRNTIYPKTPYSIPPTKNTNQILVMPLNNFNAASNRKLVTSDAVKTELMLVDDTVVPITSAATIPTLSPTPVTAMNPLTISTIPVIIKSENNASPPAADIKALKRQQRMIKNRESALLSRKKKKDYVTQLEKDVQDLRAENQQLKLENSTLKERLAAYTGSSKTSSVKIATKSVALCALLLIVAVNFDFIRSPATTNIAVTNMGVAEIKQMNDQHRRNLLWSFEATENDTKTANDLPICPMPVNQTENVRLALELHKWIGKPFNSSISGKDNVTMKSPKQKVKQSKLRNQNSLDTPVLSSVYRMGRRNRKYIQEITNNGIQVFSPSPEQIYSEFFEAINRQDDTFYVVSFSAHHMLLPALNHNKTRRPKMSLIMPSVFPNGTSSQPSVVSLMQIDCEVLDTRLIHVKYGAIPQHLRTEGNTTDPAYDHLKKENKESDAIDKQHYKNNTQYMPYFVHNEHLYKSDSNSTVYSDKMGSDDVGVSYT